MPALLSVFDFAHIELPDTVNRPAIVYNRRGLSLRLGQDDINKVLASGDNFDCLEIV